MTLSAGDYRMNLLSLIHRKLRATEVSETRC